MRRDSGDGHCWPNWFEELETIVLGFISGDTAFRWVELTLGLSDRQLTVTPRCHSGDADLTEIGTMRRRPAHWVENSPANQ